MIQGFLLEQIALGKRPYAERVRFHGKNDSVGTSEETLWPVSTLYAQLTSGVAMEAVSSSANDTSAGTGARTILVEGLDGNYKKVTETVTLNGTSPVTLSNTSVLAINKVTVATAGSGLKNAGNIDIRVTSGSVVKARVATGENRNNGAIYTIPAGHVGLLRNLDLHNQGVTATFKITLFNSDGLSFLEREVQVVNPTGTYANFLVQPNLGVGIPVPEKTLLHVGVLDSGGGVTFIGSGELLVFDVRNFGFI